MYAVKQVESIQWLVEGGHLNPLNCLARALFRKAEATAVRSCPYIMRQRWNAGTFRRSGVEGFQVSCRPLSFASSSPLSRRISTQTFDFTGPSMLLSLSDVETSL